MASSSSLTHPLPLRLIHYSPSKPTTLTSKPFIFLPSKHPQTHLTVRSSSTPTPTPTPPPLPETQQYILDGEEDVNSAPCVRTYENDLGRLTVTGDVDFDQALTAAAADGGGAAEEHVAHGLDVMVAETVFPGHADEHSTISTRLFLPSRKVKERAKRLKNYLTKEVLSSTSSTNILAMTFRQVTIRKLWSFELFLFRPGTTRDMNDLVNTREIPASFTLSSSHETAISILAEVVSVSALESTKKEFLDYSYNVFGWFKKPEKFVSKDASVVLYKVLEDEVVENAKSLLETFNSMKESYKVPEGSVKFNWWPLSVITKFEKIGGREFGAWVGEYVPAYKLQIDSGKLSDLKFEGLKECDNNRWEVLLTHSQMVCLANILDMYYEDLYTLPNKKLPYNAADKITNMNIKKKSNSVLKTLSTIITSGCFIAAIGAMGRLYFPRFQNTQKHLVANQQSQSSIRLWSMDPSMLEDVCMSIIKKVQLVYGWSGEIRKESGGGVSTGQLPDYMRRLVQVDDDISHASTSTNETDQELLAASGHKIASYQIVLSSDGRIVGFQPTSLLAVNNWASNPLTAELYGRKKLSPGFFEPSLKVKRPTEVVLLELVMSEVNGSQFVLVRPVNMAEDA
ncbi:uncharacterized protein LOC143613277 [Bidens hawaiensis]|uniref:uncharacterized protein LOC143613277 n=1 Tax=Bidens hawaiensis TaxID=980011 RepID=UPI00404B4BF5